MKKSKKILLLGAVSALAMPVAAFSLVSQSPGSLATNLDNPQRSFEVGEEDSSDGITNGSVLANITINEDDKTVSIKIIKNTTDEATIDLELFSELIGEGFAKKENGKHTMYEITEIEIEESINFPEESEELFNNSNSEDNNMELKIPDGLENHTTNVTGASYMFSWINLKNLDFSKWDMSKITDFSYMFHEATNANIDLSNSNLNIENLDKSQVAGMFSHTSGQVTLTGKMTKDLFSKFDNNSELMTMGPDEEDAPWYAIFDEEENLVGYLNSLNTPEQELIDSLEDTKKYTFKETINPNEVINELENLNQIQKFNLKIEFFKIQGNGNEINELIKKAHKLNNSMEQLQKANDNRLQTFVQSPVKDKYTDEFNKTVEELNQKVQKALETEDTQKNDINNLIKQITDLMPEFKPIVIPIDPETKDLDENKEKAKKSIDDFKNLNKDQIKAAKDKINNSSKNSEVNKVVEETKKLDEEMKDINTQLKELVENKSISENYDDEIDALVLKEKNILTSYKNIVIDYIKTLNYLNQAQKEALKKDIKSKTDAKEISKLIDDVNNLNDAMRQLREANKITLSEFIKDKDILSEDLKNTVQNLSTEIAALINKNNENNEANKNQEYIQKIIDQVNSLLSNYKQDAQNKIDALDYLNKAQRDDLKNKINRNIKPSKINEIVDNSVNLDSKMQKLNEVNEKTLSEFANDSKNLPTDLKNIVDVLNNKVSSLIAKNNNSTEANKNQEYINQLINEINSLINQYKDSLNSDLNSPKYEYLNDSQKDDLKGQLRNTNTKKELDDIASKTPRLNNKMKQLSIATVTDLQKIVDTKRFKKLSLEAKVLKNKIIVHLPTSQSSQGKNISEQEIDKYLKEIENLKVRYITPGIGNIKDITQGKKYYSGLITVNIIATVIALIATTVIIKRYKHRKQK